VLAGNGDAHSFGGNNYIIIQKDSPSYYTLKWSDPGGASSNDYDLYLLDPTLSTVYDYSYDTQNGDDEPIESIDSYSYDDTGLALVVLRWNGVDRMLHLNTNRGELAGGTNGQIYGHAGAAGCVAVAAVDATTAAGAGGTFNGTESVETFSSDGYRRVHYTYAGTAITPGNFSSTGGELRLKPVIAAADGVSTATPGFDPFYGTSAAAPHAAAIAALIIEAGLSSPSLIRDRMVDTALDIEAPGYDRDSGAGIVDALGALTTPPTITQHPIGGSAYVGDGFAFSVSATGLTVPLAYQWRHGGSDLGGETNTNLSLTGIALVDAGSYDCVVSHSGIAGLATNTASLETADHLVITTPPQSETLNLGDPYTLFVETTGGFLPLAYQWKHEGSALPGATASAYAIASFEVGDAGTYTVYVNDDYMDDETSNPALLTLTIPSLPVASLVGLAGAVLAAGILGAVRLRRRME